MKAKEIEIGKRYVVRTGSPNQREVARVVRRDGGLVTVYAGPARVLVVRAADVTERVPRGATAATRRLLREHNEINRTWSRGRAA